MFFENERARDTAKTVLDLFVENSGLNLEGSDNSESNRLTAIKQNIDSKYEEIKQKHKNAFQKITEEESELIKKKFSQNYSKTLETQSSQIKETNIKVNSPQTQVEIKKIIKNEIDDKNSEKEKEDVVKYKTAKLKNNINNSPSPAVSNDITSKEENKENNKIIKTQNESRKTPEIRRYKEKKITYVNSLSDVRTTLKNNEFLMDYSVPNNTDSRTDQPAVTEIRKSGTETVASIDTPENLRNQEVINNNKMAMLYNSQLNSSNSIAAQSYDTSLNSLNSMQNNPNAPQVSSQIGSINNMLSNNYNQLRTFKDDAPGNMNNNINTQSPMDNPMAKLSSIPSPYSDFNNKDTKSNFNYNYNMNNMSNGNVNQAPLMNEMNIGSSSNSGFGNNMNANQSQLPPNVPKIDIPGGNDIMNSLSALTNLTKNMQSFSPMAAMTQNQANPNSFGSTQQNGNPVNTSNFANIMGQSQNNQNNQNGAFNSPNANIAIANNNNNSDSNSEFTTPLYRNQATNNQNYNINQNSGPSVQQISNGNSTSGNSNYSNSNGPQFNGLSMYQNKSDNNTVGFNPYVHPGDAEALKSKEMGKTLEMFQGLNSGIQTPHVNNGNPASILNSSLQNQNKELIGSVVNMLKRLQRFKQV